MPAFKKIVTDWQCDTASRFFLGNGVEELRIALRSPNLGKIWRRSHLVNSSDEQHTPSWTTCT
ncbi:MAG: hypothetical protein KME23_23935 [Goleter apudmare HA4340-LM2]|nr:hypothetical protein [Goleter apudmare HA4340-LM2]